jgi:NADH dehydrogenase FAD-containing subunit
MKVKLARGSWIMVTPERSAHRPRIVIVGAGFGGLSVAMALANTDLAVTLVDRHNYHLFQPLLYQVATAALCPPISLRPSAESCADTRM